MARVTMYSPSGNPEVVNSLKINEFIANGYKTEEQMKPVFDAEAEQKHQEWLTSEDTKAERFSMLRQARDAKLKGVYTNNKDKLQREIRLGMDRSDKLAEWDAYAQALCALPQQDGAPWDGGGKLTPWPKMPEVTKNESASE